MHSSPFQIDTQLHQKIPASHLLPAVLYSLKSLLHNVVEYFYTYHCCKCMFIHFKIFESNILQNGTSKGETENKLFI